MPHRPHEGPAKSARKAAHQPKRDYLSGDRITPQRITEQMSAADLIDNAFQAYNAGRMNEAARLYANVMLDPKEDVTVCLTIAGAMTPPV